jgi:hypothetical protein
MVAGRMEGRGASLVDSSGRPWISRTIPRKLAIHSRLTAVFARNSPNPASFVRSSGSFIGENNKGRSTVGPRIGLRATHFNGLNARQVEFYQIVAVPGCHLVAASTSTVLLSQRQNRFAMDHHEPEFSADPALQTRSGQSEEALAQMRDDLRDAIRAQEQLQVQLRAAVKELSEALRNQLRPTALERPDPQLQLLQARIRGVEQRMDRTAEQLKGILQSRIWRTLVGAGGFLLRLRHRK